jgi:hypothetical protein
MQQNLSSNSGPSSGSSPDQKPEKVPNTERPPGDWQVSDPEKYPDQNSPGIQDPRREIKNPNETDPTDRRKKLK